MRKKKYFQKIYKFDETSKSYLIEVSLDDYDDVYDDWDPSPFKKRDIEDEFNDFIINSSEDIPLNFNINIVLYIPLNKKAPKKETALLSAYKNYYKYALEKLNISRLDLHKKTLYDFLFAVFLLTIGYFFFMETENIILQVIHEGIFIGGWVFLWEFFTNVFMTTSKMHNKYRLYKRLYDADIKFMYTE
ncbi:MAG: hypothetical protein GX308_09220 [Epulopiscium sp.]|nr:hypothetical protein [Candidatus Epulonipiscium sp.]